MAHRSREDLTSAILALQPELLRARLCTQPPPLDLDVTIHQLKTLMVLFLAPAEQATTGMRVSDLARALGVTAATASSLAERLVERGLIERREDPADRRQRRCRVSASGQQLLTQFFEAAQSQTQALLAVLTEPELEIMLRSLEIMIEATDRLLGTPSPPGYPAEPPKLASTLAARTTP